MSLYSTRTIKLASKLASACQFCDRKGDSLVAIWLDDEGYKLQQAIRQLHVGYLHKLRTSKKILIFLLIIKSLKNA